MSVVLPPLPPLPPSRTSAPPPPPPPPSSKSSAITMPISATVSPLKPTYKTINLPSHKIIIAGSTAGNRVSMAKSTSKRSDLLGSIIANMDKPAGSGPNSNSSSSTSSATTNSSLSTYAGSNNSF
ncbi:GM17060 [Drosophila sechellia]|uniref:GM17060 n=2 Tax=Drosophila sechellia TaxID=7238 RepID=B4I5L5_DROSE|nr:GM17060 [Drosophila sechellia]